MSEFGLDKDGDADASNMAVAVNIFHHLLLDEDKQCPGGMEMIRLWVLKHEQRSKVKMKILILLAFILPIQAFDEGQWKVGDCILANFTLDIDIHLHKS